MTAAVTRYFATCARGLEPILAGELARLGAGDVAPGRGGVSFAGGNDLLYRANLWLRLDLALAAVVVVLLGVVMAQSVSNHEQSVESLRAETDRMRAQAKDVAASRTRLKEAIEGANFLVRRSVVARP